MDGSGVPNESDDPNGSLLVPPTTSPLPSRLDESEKVEFDASAGSPLYSEAAPPVPPRTDEMMELSEDSLSSPLSSPATVETDLSSTSSSDQLSDEPTSASSVPVGPLYDDIHPVETVVVQPQSNDDQLASGGDSSGPTYTQPVLPSSSKKVVSVPPVAETVVYDDIDKFQNSQVST